MRHQRVTAWPCVCKETHCHLGPWFFAQTHVMTGHRSLPRATSHDVAMGLLREPQPGWAVGLSFKLEHGEIETMKSKGVANYSNEALKPVEERNVGKRKAMTKADKSVKQKKQRNAKKGPDKPKRPASAFFVFLEEFRKDFKKEDPDVKAVSAVEKAGGQKWKSMSDAEKAQYEAKAAERKSEFEKLMKAAYNKKQESKADDGDVEPDWSESEVNDEEDEASAEFINMLLVLCCLAWSALCCLPSDWEPTGSELK